MVHYVRRYNHINFQVQEKFYSNEIEGRKLTNPPKNSSWIKSITEKVVKEKFFKRKFYSTKFCCFEMI